jgi:hypothetical protein
VTPAFQIVFKWSFFLNIYGAVIAVKLDVLALVTCFAVPHPTNAKKSKSRNVNGFNGIHCLFY